MDLSDVAADTGLEILPTPRVNEFGAGLHSAMIALFSFFCARQDAFVAAHLARSRRRPLRATDRIHSFTTEGAEGRRGKYEEVIRRFRGLTQIASRLEAGGTGDRSESSGVRPQIAIAFCFHPQGLKPQDSGLVRAPCSTAQLLSRSSGQRRYRRRRSTTEAAEGRRGKYEEVIRRFRGLTQIWRQAEESTLDRTSDGGLRRCRRIPLTTSHYSNRPQISPIDADFGSSGNVYGQLVTWPVAC
jgi:hypothetical protein